MLRATAGAAINRTVASAKSILTPRRFFGGGHAEPITDPRQRRFLGEPSLKPGQKRKFESWELMSYAAVVASVLVGVAKWKSDTEDGVYDPEVDIFTKAKERMAGK